MKELQWVCREPRDYSTAPRWYCTPKTEAAQLVNVLKYDSDHRDEIVRRHRRCRIDPRVRGAALCWPRPAESILDCAEAWGWQSCGKEIGSAETGCAVSTPRCRVEEEHCCLTRLSKTNVWTNKRSYQ